MSHDPTPTTTGEMLGRPLRRRDVLALAGTAGVGAAFGFRHVLLPTSDAYAAACLLQREVTEGPYYLDLDLVRRNIRATAPARRSRCASRWSTSRTAGRSRARRSRSGTPTLPASTRASRASAATGCAASSARAPAAGSRFETIFPGWYRGRTPHIHMKVFVGGDEVHTGQVFFRPAVTRTVYGQGAYAARGQQDTSNAADMIYREAGTRALVSLKRKGRR